MIFWRKNRLLLVSLAYLAFLGQKCVWASGERLSYSERYVRQRSPFTGMHHAFNINSEELLSWLFKHRTSDFTTSDVVRLLSESPDDPENLTMRMWAGENNYDRLALACHRIVFQSPALYRQFWYIMYQAYKQHEHVQSIDEFFPAVSVHLRDLFLRAMISCAMVSDCSSQSEQLNKDFAWYISRGFAKRFTTEQLISLCRDAIASREDIANVLRGTGDIYCSVPTVALGTRQLSGSKRKPCLSLDNARCYKKSRLASDISNPVTDLVVDKDRYFENILIRGITYEQRKALERHLKTGLECGEIHPDEKWVGSALRYAQRQKEIDSIMKQCCEQKRLGRDVLALQKQFIYP